MKISELLLKYKTDKNHGTVRNIYSDLDLWNAVENPTHEFLGHTYGNAYDEILKDFDKNSNINFLEIGIQKGGSLLAWKDYFINATIYGVDIVDVILPEYRRSDFNYFISDIKSDYVREKLKEIKFDIIVDDGSHLLFDVIFVVKNYLVNLKIGGVLIIEDCQNPEYWLSEITELIKQTSNSYSISSFDLRNQREYLYDNYLIVIKKL